MGGRGEEVCVIVYESCVVSTDFQLGMLLFESLNMLATGWKEF